MDLFKDWILGEQTIKQTSLINRISERTLRYWFDMFLEMNPKSELFSNVDLCIYQDNKLLKHDICILLLTNRCIAQLTFFSKKKGWQKNIKEYLINIINSQRNIVSVTCNLSVYHQLRLNISTLKVQLDIPDFIQWSLRSIQSSSNRKETRQLKTIIAALSEVSSSYSQKEWIDNFCKWNFEYKSFLTEKVYNLKSNREEYVNQSVRKLCYTINKVIPNLFRYIDNASIPKSYDQICNYRQLKKRLGFHRGLSTLHQRSFLKWYVYFYNKIQ